MRHPLGATLLLALTVASPAVSAQDPGENPLGEPNGVHVAYGEDPSSSMVISWAGPPAEESFVKYGTAVRQQEVQATPEPLPGTDQVAYSATLEDLNPDTSYVYTVETGGVRSEVFRFRTAPAPGGEEGPRFTFAAWADHGVRDPFSPMPGPSTPAPTRNADLAQEIDPDFHLAAGDISYAKGHAPTWDRYFDAFQPYLAETPYMTVPGDHERERGQGYTQYDARLEMPDEPRDRWYAFRYANALVVGLNTGEMCREEEAVQATPTDEWTCGGPDDGASQDRGRYPNPRQLFFLESRLQEASRTTSIDWTIVVHHHPAYSSGPSGPDPDVQQYWVPLYDEHGVDLVISGHDQVYQRSQPLRYGNTSGPGTTYVVNGAGGAGLQALENGTPDWEAASVGDAWGTASFTVDGERLTGRFLDLDGTVRDEFVLENREDGAAVVDPPTGEPSGDASDERDPRDTREPEPNRRGNTTAAPNVTQADDDRGGVDATPQEDQGAEGVALPSPGLGAVLAAALLAARRRR